MSLRSVESENVFSDAIDAILNGTYFEHTREAVCSILHTREYELRDNTIVFRTAGLYNIQLDPNFQIGLDAADALCVWIPGVGARFVKGPVNIVVSIRAGEFFHGTYWSLRSGRIHCAGSSMLLQITKL